MSSSAAAAARAPEPEATSTSPFPYPEAELAAGDNAAAEERRQRQLADTLEQGRQQGRHEALTELNAIVQGERARIAEALAEFTVERQGYYRRVEREVVQLALAIARKILHRETQLDPYALIGIVRVTLEKLDVGTKVILHVPPKEAAEWRHYFACQTEGLPAPEVREDPALESGACRIETSLGTTDVGFDSQLKEVEAGLLDLLAERPGK